MKTLISTLFVGLSVLAMGPAAKASEAHRNIEAIRFNVGDSRARVSLRFGTSTDCGADGWYAYEDADSGLGGLWTDAVLEAYTNQKAIKVVGTGLCDTFGVETIEFIDLAPIPEPSLRRGPVLVDPPARRAPSNP
ncbi:MAG: hypothetical protein ACREXR_11680 [Gammaproteobacteria bacterium]